MKSILKLPLAGCLRIAANGSGLGEGGLVGCSNLAVIVCPPSPNPCYVVVFFFIFFCGGYFFRLIFNELRYFNKIL